VYYVVLFVINTALFLHDLCDFGSDLKGGTTPASSNRPGIFETFVPLAQLVTVSKQGTTVG